MKSAYDCHLSTNIFTELQAGLEADFVFHSRSQGNIIDRAGPAQQSVFFICSFRGVQGGDGQFRTVLAPVKDISFIGEAAVMVLLDS